MRSSSPYPFHPDRLDPGAAKPDVDESIRWYYDNEGQERKKPFVGGERRSASSAAREAVVGSGVALAISLLASASLQRWLH